MSAPDLAETSPDGVLDGYVIILHTGDWHGDAAAHLGMSRVAYARAALEEAGAQVVLVDTGNALCGTGEDADPETAKAAVQVMDASGYAALLVGASEDALAAEADLEALFDGTDISLLSCITGEGSAASLTLELGGLRLGLLALNQGETDDGEALAETVSHAAETASALLEKNCDAVVALVGIDALDDAGLSALAGELEGKVSIFLVSGENLTGGWQESGALVSCAGTGLETIGCVVIDPSGNVSRMILDETWFDTDMFDADVQAMIDQAKSPDDAENGGSDLSIDETAAE